MDSRERGFYRSFFIENCCCRGRSILHSFIEKIAAFVMEYKSRRKFSSGHRYRTGSYIDKNNVALLTLDNSQLCNSPQGRL